MDQIECGADEKIQGRSGKKNLGMVLYFAVSIGFRRTGEVKLVEGKREERSNAS